MNDLEHELRKVIAGDVRFDPASRLLYATDASMYQVEPIGVVVPRDRDDVEAAIGLAARFQASYCKPCVRESPAFGRLVDRYRERPVEFLALHVQDTVADTRRFIKDQKVTYPVALDPKLAIGNTFGFKGTPYTVVVDLKGEMVAQIHGESALSRLPRIIDSALAEAPKG